MNAKRSKPLTEYIVPLHMNGLRGRMLRLPSPNKARTKEILIIYGSHASIERMLGFAEELNKYGAVTIPDLPGFGGMESFYKIGEKPTLDNFADYLAAFIKLRYKNRRITIIGVSLGFAITTRMLQKYPALARKVDDVISIVGFTHHSDFSFSASTKMLFRYFPVFFSLRVPAWFVSTFVLREPIIRAAYSLAGEKNTKMQGISKSDKSERIAFEVGLWKSNDIRTYMDTAITMMKLDLCDQKINLPIYHVAVVKDHFFDHHRVEQHMRVIYSDYIQFTVSYTGHAPTVVPNARAAARFIPRKLRTLLSK